MTDFVDQKSRSPKSVTQSATLQKSVTEIGRAICDLKKIGHDKRKIGPRLKNRSPPSPGMRIFDPLPYYVLALVVNMDPDANIRASRGTLWAAFGAIGAHPRVCSDHCTLRWQPFGCPRVILIAIWCHSVHYLARSVIIELPACGAQ